MVGGSYEAFIGAVHRKAAAIDNEIELVGGAFSSSPEKSDETGRQLYLNKDRVYPDYKTMITREAKLPEGERMDFITIVTPNHLHFGPAKMALEHGFHVMVDKPITFSLQEALDLKKQVDETGLLLGLTHTYSGYPMIKEARQLVKNGTIGPIKKIYVEYPQGWLSTPLEQEGSKQATWRTDPSKSGKAGAMGDIGTHAAHLAWYVSGLDITRLSARLNRVVPGRLLDDDGSVLLEFENGATGELTATQIATGEENNMKLRIYGEKAGIEWNHTDPSTLLVKWIDKPMETLRAGANLDYLSEAARSNCRLPSGHPEGFLEAFANIYRNFALAIRAQGAGKKLDLNIYDFPGVDDGIMGMTFIDKVVESSEKNQTWLKF